MGIEKQRLYIANVEYLIEKIIRFARIDSLTLGQIVEYLGINILTGQRQLSRVEDVDDNGAHVICTTVHKSKGLEYGTVILPYTFEDISDIKKKSYSKYLRSFINRGAQDQVCSVTLEFEINNETCENYIIKRSWNAERKRTRERISVTKDGEYSGFLTSNWPLFVENILPSALSSFFFFDGEKIAELAVDSTNVQLKNSIRSMLGISVLDVLSNDITRNLKKINKKETKSQTSEEIQRIREEKELAAKELERVDLALEKANKKLAKDNSSLEALHQLYTAKGGDAVNKRQETLKERSTLAAELSKTKDNLYVLVSEEMPLLLVGNFITEIKLQATDEHTSAIMQESLQQLDSIFAEFVSQYNGDKNAGNDFVNYVKKHTEDNQTEVIYGLSEHALFQVNNLVEGVLEDSLV